MDIVTRALGYPYTILPTSYVVDRGRVLNWDDSISLQGRIPILACGSNQSPEQLIRKFPFDTIPVTAGWLEGFDSVYSAHFTSYGSIAATLMAAQNVCSRQMITWLEKDQLNIMHDSEALGINYAFVELDGLTFESDEGRLYHKAMTYTSLHGVLKLDGAAVGVSAIKADGRPYAEMDQETLQEEVLQRLDLSHSLETFVQENVEMDGVRHKRTQSLKKRLG